MNWAVLTQMGFTELIIAQSLLNNADERPGGILLPYSVHIYLNTMIYFDGQAVGSMFD